MQRTNRAIVGVALLSVLLLALAGATSATQTDNSSSNSSSTSDGFGFVLLATFASIVLFFHASEIFITWLYNKDQLSFQTLLLSWHYGFAMTLSLVEFFVEWYYFPWLKSFRMWPIALIGFSIACIGEAIRKSAMITAKKAFTHQIQFSLRRGHKLVTWGLYRYIRHPGYFGWMLWAPGHQIMLLNPICSVLFFIVAVYFFNDRIPFEEERLVELFGEEYKRYCRRTPTYIPFCK